MYDPNLGRFITRDPIGYEDGVNLYEYVGSGPIDGLDPQGLEERKKPIFEPPVLQIGTIHVHANASCCINDAPRRVPPLPKKPVLPSDIPRRLPIPPADLGFVDIPFEMTIPTKEFPKLAALRGNFPAEKNILNPEDVQVVGGGIDEFKRYMLGRAKDVMKDKAKEFILPEVEDWAAKTCPLLFKNKNKNNMRVIGSGNTTKVYNIEIKPNASIKINGTFRFEFGISGSIVF